MTDETTSLASVRVEVLEPLRTVNKLLLELLEGLGEAQWHLPTVHRDRDVKDLTAHLLHGSLRRVTALRDGYHRATAAFGSVDDIIAFIQQDNREFMTGMRRLSPRILVELIANYDRELCVLFERLDPDAPGLGVAWAGEMVSRNWFDIAREYTEKWHHQQQLRDALGCAPLYDRALFAPVLETFARGLPHALRDYAAREGTCVTLATTGALEASWTLRRTAALWSLAIGSDPSAQADSAITIPAEVAWRLWTKGVTPELGRRSVELRGDPAALEPLLRFVAIMA